MKEKLIQLIKQENKKNPYTDEQLASLLGVRRELVTLKRREENIGNSRERRKGLLMEVLTKEVQNNAEISERELIKKVRQKGFDVSRHLIREFKKETLHQNIVSRNYPLKKNL